MNTDSKLSILSAVSIGIDAIAEIRKWFLIANQDGQIDLEELNALSKIINLSVMKATGVAIQTEIFINKPLFNKTIGVWDIFTFCATLSIDLFNWVRNSQRDGFIDSNELEELGDVISGSVNQSFNEEIQIIIKRV